MSDLGQKPTLLIAKADAPIPWPAVAAVMTALSVFVLTLGLTYPLLAVIMERAGLSGTFIGFNAAIHVPPSHSSILAH